ncbi:MAG: hypothetical protein M0Q91_18410 [Methanoregula sp.]|jgi:ATP-dependent protease HslVU (ClpYQ) peptidase subunit|nr:hypothetical protein [Methanoregula sp.]
MKNLIAFASIGAEHKRLQSLREEKIKEVMKNLSDDEYEQMLELAKKTGDEQMIRDLPIMRAMVKK